MKKELMNNTQLDKDFKQFEKAVKSLRKAHTKEEKEKVLLKYMKDTRIIT